MSDTQVATPDVAPAAEPTNPSALMSTPGIAPVPGENGKQVMARLPVRYLDALYDKELDHYSNRFISLYYALQEITLPGDYAEFGVFRGHCARFLENLMIGPRKLHLFDAFKGLPEAWTEGMPKGKFNLQGKVPKFNKKKSVVYKGWFKNTVAPFAEQLQQPLAFIHMDADLYSSTMDVFKNLDSKIVPGTIIVFDEYVYRGEEEEHQALLHWAESYNREFEYLWRTKWVQVCIRVTK